MTALMLAAQSSNPTHAPLATSSGILLPASRRRAMSAGTVNASEDTATINTLLAHNASLHCRDKDGNTALHHASAWGNLKAVRVLLAAGSASLPLNQSKHTPLDYSVTSQAARYFQSLIAEFERSGSNHGAVDDHDRRPSTAISVGPVSSPVQTRLYHKDAFGGKGGPQSSVRLVVDPSPGLDPSGRGEF
jgi:ankyrin repeat protein